VLGLVLDAVWAADEHESDRADRAAKFGKPCAARRWLEGLRRFSAVRVSQRRPPRVSPSTKLAFAVRRGFSFCKPAKRRMFCERVVKRQLLESEREAA